MTFWERNKQIDNTNSFTCTCKKKLIWCLVGRTLKMFSQPMPMTREFTITNWKIVILGPENQFSQQKIAIDRYYKYSKNGEKNCELFFIWINIFHAISNKNMIQSGKWLHSKQIGIIQKMTIFYNLTFNFQGNNFIRCQLLFSAGKKT